MDDAPGTCAPARRGGLGRLRSAAAVSGPGGVPRTAVLPPLAVLAAAVALGHAPPPIAAAFFALSVIALIPARLPDVPVVASGDARTTAHVTR
ncbi:hypothetical protein [Streptomyces sp. NPDC093094]|uniref:hypothetical protein n=1 Tax=Streptomyces sp. NPDC093094 TaxID=3366026 RepID=UPI003825F7E4